MSVTAQCLINAKYASSSPATEYTVPAARRVIIDKFSASNQNGGAQTITVYLVPSGGSVANSNKIVSSFSLAAGESKELTELKNQILNTGDFVSVEASVGSAIVIRMSGRVVA